MDPYGPVWACIGPARAHAVRETISESCTFENYTGVDPKHDWAGIATVLCNLEHPCRLMVGSIWEVACWAGRAGGEAGGKAGTKLKATLGATATSRAGSAVGEAGGEAGSKAGGNGNFKGGQHFRNSLLRRGKSPIMLRMFGE